MIFAYEDQMQKYIFPISIIQDITFLLYINFLRHMETEKFFFLRLKHKICRQAPYFIGYELNAFNYVSKL